MADAAPTIREEDLRQWKLLEDFRQRLKPFLAQQPGVASVHDMHIWAMSTTETALTAHLVMPAGYPGDKAIDEIVTRLRHDFAIGHCTLQVEEGTMQHQCALVT